MSEQAKAWIDYRVDDLRRYVEPLDGKGCVQNPDFDKAMHASAINELVNLRENLDNPNTPVGYPKAEHAYLHDEDMQRLRGVNRKHFTAEDLFVMWSGLLEGWKILPDHQKQSWQILADIVNKEIAL